MSLTLNLAMKSEDNAVSQSTETKIIITNKRNNKIPIENLYNRLLDQLKVTIELPEKFAKEGYTPIVLKSRDKILVSNKSAQAQLNESESARLSLARAVPIGKNYLKVICLGTVNRILYRLAVIAK